MAAAHPDAGQGMGFSDGDDEPAYSTPPEFAADALALRGDVLPTASILPLPPSTSTTPWRPS